MQSQLVIMRSRTGLVHLNGRIEGLREEQGECKGYWMNWTERCFSKCERLDSQISNISISSTLLSIFLAAPSTLLNKKAIQCPNSRARYITP